MNPYQAVSFNTFQPCFKKVVLFGTAFFFGVGQALSARKNAVSNGKTARKELPISLL